MKYLKTFELNKFDYIYVIADFFHIGKTNKYIFRTTIDNLTDELPLH